MYPKQYIITSEFFGVKLPLGRKDQPSGPNDMPFGRTNKLTGGGNSVVEPHSPGGTVARRSCLVIRIGKRKAQSGERKTVEALQYPSCLKGLLPKP